MPQARAINAGKKVETPEPDHAGEEQEKAPVNQSASLFSNEYEVERKVVKPPNQLELTEEELAADNDGVPLHEARVRKQRKHAELLCSRSCRLVGVALQLGAYSGRHRHPR